MKQTELTSEQQQFRNAMARMAAAVSIVTTDGKAGKGGITATSICSITDTPPTILVCVHRNSQMNKIFKENEKLCINILSSNHVDIAKHFAGMTQLAMEARFTSNDWHTSSLNLPFLKNALAILQGQIKQINEIGTHSLFLVELNTIQTNLQGDGLLYFDRDFRTLSQQTQAI